MSGAVAIKAMRVSTMEATKELAREVWEKLTVRPTVLSRMEAATMEFVGSDDGQSRGSGDGDRRVEMRDDMEPATMEATREEIREEIVAATIEATREIIREDMGQR